MKRPIQRLAYTREEAAAALGMGTTSFDERVAPFVRVYRQGRLRLFPVRELERWLEDNAERVLET